MYQIRCSLVREPTHRGCVKNGMHASMGLMWLWLLGYCLNELNNYKNAAK